MSEDDRELFPDTCLKGTFGLNVEDVSRSPKLLSKEASLSSKLTSSSSSSILELRVLDFLDKSEPRSLLPLLVAYALSTLFARSKAVSPGVD